MRAFLPILCLLLFGTDVLAQADWLPLSRDVEMPYATAQQAYKANEHTAIRPYRRSDISLLNGADSLRPEAALKVLDKWAGAIDERKFRWGPLLDANGGYDTGAEGAVIHRGGAGFWSDYNVNDKLTFHLDAQAWSERFANYVDTLIQATQVTPGEGYAYGSKPNYVHYDWNGYVSWDASKYFNFTLGKGKNSFGEGYRSLFLSDEAYSYPYLKITTSVWHIKYVNLFTMMNDIRGANGVVSDYRRKYASMHYLSYNVTPRINFAVFEGIVFSAGDSLYPRGFDMNYVNPVLFYRPAEYSIGSPDNALVGIAINVKAGKHVLVYSQIMLDEMLFFRVREGRGWYANKQAVQLGIVARDAFKVKDLTLRLEWNYIRPFIYTHSDTRQNYAQFGQPLAHPYGSNSNEFVLQADLLKGRMRYSLHTSYAILGTDTGTYSYGNNIFRPENERPLNDEGKPDDFGYYMGGVANLNVFHGEIRAGYLLDPATSTRLEASALVRSASSALGTSTTDLVFRLGIVCYFRDRHVEQQVRYRLP
ncbi:MAG: hypothetical protein WAR83_00340 [Flavobacteriales bacterium]|nr:hypothetical protein [Flavobacteriales bacterium]